MLVGKPSQLVVGAVLHRMRDEHKSGIGAERSRLRFRPLNNSVVATPTVGMPRSSRFAMSCVQHDMHDPQSLSPSMTRFTSPAICCCSGSGAGRVLVGFL
jgi:hypothetical protein